jgi:AcrR family transcriptional regulator
MADDQSSRLASSGMSRSNGVTARGERTRERLLDVAEQLMGERGIEGVSLREIRLAANQRNTSALQFHFGDRDGLLNAIVERHRMIIQRKMNDLYDAMVADGRQDDSRSLVEVFVRPVADYVFDGPSPRSWVRIVAELGARPELHVHDFVASSSPEALKVGNALLDKLEVMMPRRMGFDRVFMMSLATLHLCADRARIEGAKSAGRSHMSPEDFVETVVDMAHAALFAPLRRVQPTS